MDLAQVGEGARLTLLGPGASILLGRGRSSPRLPRPADQTIIISQNVFADQFLKAKSLAQSSTITNLNDRRPDASVLLGRGWSSPRLEGPAPTEKNLINSHLAECINQIVLEIQLPHKIDNLMFE